LRLMRDVFLGWDAREGVAFNVAEASIQALSSVSVAISSISYQTLCDMGVYRRPTERRDGVLWDVISEAPMSTEHAIARFFVPYLTEYSGFVLFADSDILLRDDIADLFSLADDRYAVQVVKHSYTPAETMKMDGQIQTAYARKNWSSVMLWNCEHPAHRALTLDILNHWPGRDLHAFKWLRDEEIGALPAAWNYLVGVSPKLPDVKLAHFTLGLPNMAGYEQCEFAEEWRAYERQTWLERAI
jgi:hypothetical protein